MVFHFLGVLTIIGKKNSRNLLQRIEEKLVEITEGTTKILVPEKSLEEKVPPKEPAFFNPVAKLNRDFSILAYSAFWENFEKPKIFLMHGANDTIVSPIHLLEAKEYLVKLGLKIKTKLFKDCEHRIPVEGSSLGLGFLKKNLL